MFIHVHMRLFLHLIFPSFSYLKSPSLSEFLNDDIDHYNSTLAYNNMVLTHLGFQFFDFVMNYNWFVPVNIIDFIALVYALVTRIS